MNRVCPREYEFVLFLNDGEMPYYYCYHPRSLIDLIIHLYCIERIASKLTMPDPEDANNSQSNRQHWRGVS